DYEAKTRTVQKEIAEVKRKAIAEARDMVRSTKATIEQAIKEIRESSARPEVVRAARQELREMTERLHTQLPPEETQDLSPESFRTGDYVRLRDGSQVGEICQIQKEYAVVTWGDAKMRVPLSGLVKQTSMQGPLYSAPRKDLPQIDAKNEIDLRGLMGDEAVSEVERFLDNAFVSGLHRVDIIHGKGTGALRKRISEFLKTCPHVKSFHLGEWNEGGTGVTVVEIS
ncbi:MAG TPA: Smr/MutS family protein, partial [Bacteroidota bacterium]